MLGTALTLLIVLLALAVPVAAGLGIMGIVLSAIYSKLPRTVAMGEIKKRGYSERLFLGTIAAGGTLGILIPPSINMIVYGVLTDSSIPKLYLAGILPGLILAGLFSLTVLAFCLARPELGGKRMTATWRERWRALPDL